MDIQLDPLPPSENEFWQGAEVNKIELKPVKECKHRFKRTKKSREVECVNCHIGYMLDARSTLKDGHIYIGGELAI